jgi:tetratricopeptide (TPR) repeat protein
MMVAVWTLLCAIPSQARAQPMPDAPASLPIPPPPPAVVPSGFTSVETARARIHVAPGSAQDADAFARDWGLLIDDGMDQLDTFLQPFGDKLDIYVYPDDLAFGQATSNARWPELEPVSVLANPGIGDLAVDLQAFQRATPLEAENALRHGMAHVAIRNASRGRAPRGFDEGLAAYFEHPVPAQMARHAALVQNARSNGDLLTWSDLNRPLPPEAEPAQIMAHAYAMVAYFIDRDGAGKLGEFIGALSGEPDWRAVMRETYNRAPAELEAQWVENLPRWTTGGWRTNLLAGFDLEPARDLIAKGHYASARRELEQSLRLFTDLDDETGIELINDLMAQTDIGLQAETLMGQTQASLELHDYDRAQDLLNQAQSQFERLGGVQAPDETMAVYAGLSQQGLRAEQDLERARVLSRRWADYPLARQAALSAGSGYAELGDGAGYESSAAVMKALDERQLRLVLLVGGLTLLSGAWLGLWLWSRGKSPLDWEH